MDRFVPVSGTNFALNATTGEAIFLYCMTDNSTIQHISAITNTGGWATNNVTEGNSLLPADLQPDMVTTLPFFSNYEYDGPSVGNASTVQVGLSTPTNWDGSNVYISNLQTKSSFQIVDNHGSGARSSCFSAALTCVLLALSAGIFF